MFGVTLDTWKGFTRSGRVACGRWFAKPTGGRCMLYPVAELQRLVGGLGAGRPFPPPGYVDGDGAVRVFEEADRRSCVRVARRPLTLTRLCL